MLGRDEFESRFSSPVELSEIEEGDEEGDDDDAQPDAATTRITESETGRARSCFNINVQRLISGTLRMGLYDKMPRHSASSRAHF